MPPKIALQQQNFINSATTSQGPQKKADRAMQEERPIVSVAGNNWGEDEQLNVGKKIEGMGGIDNAYIDQKFGMISMELKNFVHEEVQN